MDVKLYDQELLPVGRYWWTIRVVDAERMTLNGLPVEYLVDPSDMTVTWPRTAPYGVRMRALSDAELAEPTSGA